MSDLKYWLGFNIVSGIGPAKVQALLDAFGTLRQAWSAAEEPLRRIGLDQRAIENLRQARESLDLDQCLARASAAGVELLTWESPAYPRCLREISNPPPLLYLRGRLIDEDCWAVAVVGTRRMTAYGRQVTRDLVAGLVSSGITVVSGLARGVDAVAHKTALDCGGRTIAVLGSGLDQIYPPENRSLVDRILEGDQGVVISEYYLGIQPDGRNFPPRNRLISGLSLGVIIVEAGERSGALITATFALEQNREVFAVPGNVNSPVSRGPNHLIQQGAKLVTGIDDVLEELNLTRATEYKAVQLALPESAEEALIMTHLSQQPIHVDELSRAAGLSSSLVSSTLTLMELKGMALQVGGMHYILAREPDPQYNLGRADI